MAKAKTQEFQNLKFGQIAFNHNLVNAVVRKERRSPKASQILLYSFAREGWDAQRGMIGVFGPDSPIWASNPAYQKSLDDLYKENKAKFERLSSSNKEEDKVELTVFKELNCDDKGNVLRPRVLAATCNGRGDVYYDSQVLRARGFSEAKWDDTTPPKDPLGEVPVQFRVFNTEAERIHFQINENSKEIGFFEMTTLDKFRTIAFLCQHGMTYAEARKKYSGTVGQKSWLLVRLDFLWSEFCNDRFKDEPRRPNLDLVGRAQLTPKDPRYIKFESLNDVGKLAELIARSTPDGLLTRNRQIDKDNLAAENEGKELKNSLSPATEEDVERFVTGQDRDTAKKAGKVMSKDTWDSYKNSKNHVLKNVAEAHLANNTENVKPLVENKDAFNKLWVLSEEGKGTDALLAMSLVSHPLFERFAELALSGKEFEIVEKTAVPAS